MSDFWFSMSVWFGALGILALFVLLHAAAHAVARSCDAWLMRRKAECRLRSARYVVGVRRAGR